MEIPIRSIEFPRAFRKRVCTEVADFPTLSRGGVLSKCEKTFGLSEKLLLVPLVPQLTRVYLVILQK